MLSVEIIDQLRREEEERRQERERPTARIPVEQPLEEFPAEQAAEQPEGGSVVVVELSKDDVDQFRVLSW